MRNISFFTLKQTQVTSAQCYVFVKLHLEDETNIILFTYLMVTF